MNQKHLLRKMQSAQATRRIWIDEQSEPFPLVACWCSATMELDYEQGYELMTQRLSAWLNSHADCQPKVEERASMIDANPCYSCCVAPRQPESIYCKDCRQERDDEVQDFYDSQWSEHEYRLPSGEEQAS